MFLSDVNNKHEHTASDGNWFKKSWNAINLLVGNSRRFNCRSPRYRNKIMLSIVTFYMLMFTLGLFAGDLVASHIINLEKLFGMFSTAIVFSLGFSVVQTAWRNRHATFGAIVSVLLMGSQTAFVFNLFPVEIANIFYYFATIVTMIFTYTIVHRENVKKAIESTVENR